VLRLKYERHIRGFTQAHVAAAVRVFQSELCLMENGRLVPTPAQLQRLADAFRVQPASKLLEHVVVMREEAR